MSSSCARVTGAMPRAMRRVASHQPMANPARYMRPYQRTASGPMEKAIGSMFGWISMALACAAPCVREKIARRGADFAAAPREPHIEAWVRVGNLAVDHPAAAKVGNRRRHDRHAQSARHQAHHRLHLYRLLRHLKGEARACREPGDYIVEPGRDLARHHDERLTCQIAHRDAPAPTSQLVSRGQRGDEFLALHDE